MPTTRLFAYNSGTTINGTYQIGDIAIGESTTLNYSQNAGGVRWWNGPDEDLGYVIAHTTPSGTQPNPDNVPAYIGFWRTTSKTENSLISLTNSLFGTSYTTGGQCKTYLNDNGYWTSYLDINTLGLIVELDAYSSVSYPSTGSTVYNLRSGSYNHTLTNATYTILNGIKCFDCTTGNNRVVVNGTGPTLPTTGYTYITWARLIPSTVGFRTLLYTNSPKYTPITIPNGVSTLGYWDTEFRSSGYDVSSSSAVWVQYAVVGDNSSQTFYINGSQVGSSINYGAGGTTHWGWGNNDVVSQPFGYVSNMYLYNRKLSITEISEQYNFLAPRFIEIPNQGFSYSNFASTVGLTAVGNASVVSNIYYLTTAGNAQTGNVYRTTAIQYNRNFSTQWSTFIGGGTGADGYCIQWTPTNNTNGSGGGGVGLLSTAINAITFLTYINNNFTWYKNNVSQGATSVTSGFWRQTLYFWGDYNHSAQTFALYWNTTNTKPVSPNKTFTSFLFDTGSYYMGFGAATGGANDNHQLINWSLTFT